MLLIREGGRNRTFDWSEGYQDGYIPRELTFELPERIDAQGRVLRRLDERAVEETAAGMAEIGVEAVAVCLLWSIVNPTHELRVGELLAEHLPGVPYTLSHELNPTLREYRRASSTAIDASLKPLMTEYLGNLERALGAGRVQRRAAPDLDRGRADAHPRSRGEADHLDQLRPGDGAGRGPPLRGRRRGADTAIVTDTGGTSYDVSVVRGGRIPMTREAWLGEPLHRPHHRLPRRRRQKHRGRRRQHRLDRRRRSAPRRPAERRRGPGARSLRPWRGAADGHRRLPRPGLSRSPALPRWGNAARRRAGAHRDLRDVAAPLGLKLQEAASAILALATEQMVQAIKEVTVDAGIDPRDAVLIGGGGAAGLNGTAIMRRLGCGTMVVPEAGATLSAVGALMADLGAEFTAAFFTSTDDFDSQGADVVLAELRDRCERFAAEVGGGEHSIEMIAEARHARQVWQIDLPLRGDRFGDDPVTLENFLADFRDLHDRIFAVRDDRSAVEIIGLRARVTCPLSVDSSQGRMHSLPSAPDGEREIYFSGHGPLRASVRSLAGLAEGEQLFGPALVESPLTTIVVEPGTVAMRAGASLIIRDSGGEPEREEARRGAAVRS